jgi:hypothetical protein
MTPGSPCLLSCLQMVCADRWTSNAAQAPKVQVGVGSYRHWGLHAHRPLIDPWCALLGQLLLLLLPCTACIHFQTWLVTSTGCYTRSIQVSSGGRLS